MISPVPAIVTHVRTGQESFLLLACDGIFEAMENHQAGTFVAEKLQNDADLGDLCEGILDYCYENKSGDNMSALLVRFN